MGKITIRYLSICWKANKEKKTTISKQRKLIKNGLPNEDTDTNAVDGRTRA